MIDEMPLIVYDFVIQSFPWNSDIARESFCQNLIHVL